MPRTVKIMNKQLAFLLSIKAYGAAISYCTIIALSHNSNQESVSVLNFAIASMLISSVLFIFGQNVSIFKTSGTEKYSKTNLYAFSLLLVVITTIAGGFFLLSTSSIAMTKNIEMKICALCVIYSISELASIALRNEGSYVSSLLPREILWRTTVFVFILGPWSSNAEPTLDFLNYTLLLCIAIQIAIYYRLPHRSNLNITFSYYEHAYNSGVAFLITFLGVLNIQAITFICYNAYEASIANEFFIAERTSNLLVFILTASSLYFAPKFTKSQSNKKRQKYLRQAAILGVASYVFFIMAFTAFWNLGCFGITKICEVSSNIFFLIFLAQLPNVATGIVAFALQALGSSNLYFKVLLSISFLAFSLQLYMSATYPIEAIALISVISSLVSNIISATMLWRIHGLRADIFMLLKLINGKRG